MKSVRIIDTCRNYQDTLSALYCLDLMISDGCFYDQNANIPLKLIKQLLAVAESSLSLFDLYISSMVKAYIRRKRQIAVYFAGINLIRDKIKGFITEGEMRRVETTENGWSPNKLSGSRSNIISSNIISVFPNVTTIIIKAGDEADAYPFDMFYFASSIVKASNWKVIKIEQLMWKRENFDKSWISKLWRLSAPKLIHHYEQQQFNISFHKYTARNHSYESFTIRRL